MARQRKKKKMIVPLDFEFDLPEDIIQHIQSFMDVKQAAGTCLLSKSWYQAWSTRPILAFPVRIKRKTATIEKDAAIRKSIISGMKKYKKSNLNLQKLDFRFLVLYSDKYARLVDNYGSLLDELIRDASDLGVKELHLDGSSCLCVPDRVFTVTSLNKLSIQGCTVKKWPIHNILGLVSQRITSVSVGLGDYDRMIQDILLQCPSMEHLDLEHVNWDGTINLGGLHNLVYLRVRAIYGGRSNVSFEPITSGGLVNSVPQFHKLRSVCLEKVRIQGGFFTKFSTRFPCIEDLSLDCCDGYEENIKISNKSLKHLTLEHRSYKVEKAEFDVPNIRKFEYGSHFIPALSFSTVSRNWESKVGFHGTTRVGTSWFVGLREFLKELSKSRISLLVTLEPCRDISCDLPSSPKPLVGVENLTLHYNHPPAQQALLSALFGCCRPTFITLHLSSDMSNHGIIGYVQQVHKLFAHCENTSRCFSSMQSLIKYHIKEIGLQFFEERARKTIKLTNFVTSHSNVST